MDILMKLCDVCGKRVAVIHVAEVDENGEVKSVSLCEECARKEGIIPGGSPKKQEPEELLNEITKNQEDLPEEKRLRRCPECGLTYEEFRIRGRLGCPKDYEVFAEMLEGLLEKIHYGLEHKGRVPPSGDAETKRLRKIVELKRRLEEAVAREEYELAAKIRDQINKLEEEEKK